jgi:hypothetical protein
MTCSIGTVFGVVGGVIVVLVVIASLVGLIDWRS